MSPLEKLYEIAKEFRTRQREQGWDAASERLGDLDAAIAACDAEVYSLGEPVTEAWLESIGFRMVRRRDGRVFAAWRHGVVFDFPQGQASVDPDTPEARLFGASPQTRGGVLDLLDSLHSERRP